MTQPAASDVRVGSVLRDTYEITSVLGKGGMGAVYLARHRRLPSRQVAVKVLRGGADLSPEQYARFRREAEITSRLGHPNIVEMLDFDTLEDGTPFLVMEYLRGESLEQRLARGPLSLEEMSSLTRQMGSGLVAAHRAGVVHRDLKPANVWLVPMDLEGGASTRVKLLDFGISKLLDSQTLQTQDSVLMGTPQYMAPEQAMGRNSEVDTRTDLFALGCIVYEMLSGRSPFEGEDNRVLQVIFRIVHTPPEPLAHLRPGLPEHVLSAVERALSKSARDRHEDVAAFILELTGRPLLSQSGIAIPKVTSPSSPSPSMAAVAAGTGRFSMDGEGEAPTHVPVSTVRFTAPGDDVGHAATHLSTPAQPAPTARFAAPEGESGPLARPPGDIRRARVVPKWAVGVGWAVLVGLGTATWWATRSPPSVTPVAPPSVPGRPPLPEEVLKHLEAAESALAAGNSQEAIRFARLSQHTRTTPESFVVLIRAYCLQSDLANANAKWREGKSLLSDDERKQVRRYCKKHEIDL